MEICGTVLHALVDRPWPGGLRHVPADQQTVRHSRGESERFPADCPLCCARDHISALIMATRCSPDPRLQRTRVIIISAVAGMYSLKSHRATPLNKFTATTLLAHSANRQHGPDAL